MTLKKFLSSALLCLLLLSLPGTCSAQYQMTEAELTRLEQIFQQLSANNNQLLMDLDASKADLATARGKLAQYQQDLATLQAQLLALKDESAQAQADLLTAQASLQKANQSLEQYAKEVKNEERTLKLQRDLGYFAAITIAILK